MHANMCFRATFLPLLWSLIIFRIMVPDFEHDSFNNYRVHTRSVSDSCLDSDDTAQNKLCPVSSLFTPPPKGQLWWNLLKSLKVRKVDFSNYDTEETISICHLRIVYFHSKMIFKNTLHFQNSVVIKRLRCLGCQRSEKWTRNVILIGCHYGTYCWKTEGKKTNASKQCVKSVGIFIF